MSPITLWVDALVIDQSNNSGRGQQVKLMRRIYSRAAKVLVWLGPASDDSNLAVNLIKRYSPLPWSSQSGKIP